ncbi:hypothetical protein EMIT0373P_60611 [Pseudomonas chlororaphis]
MSVLYRASWVMAQFVVWRSPGRVMSSVSRQGLRIQLPVSCQRVDHCAAHSIGRLERGSHADETRLVMSHALRGAHAGWLHGVVTGGTQYQHAVQVHLRRFAQETEGLQGSGVLHGGGHELSFAVGPVLDPVTGPVVEPLAVPERRGGEVVAFHDPGRQNGLGEALELLAKRCQFLVFYQWDVLGQVVGPIHQSTIELVDFADAVRTWLGIRRCAKERGVAGFPVFGDFPCIDLVRQVTVHHIVGPCRRTDGALVRIDAGNARDQPVRLAQVKAWIHAQGHYRRRRTGSAHAGHRCQDAGFRVQAYVMKTLGERHALIQAGALTPELKLARVVSLILADLEHAQNYSLDLNRLLGGLGCSGCAQAAQRGSECATGCTYRHRLDSLAEGVRSARTLHGLISGRT